MTPEKQDINSLLSKFPPYSDFNFISMHSWNIKEDMQVSELHGNLVVRFKDYHSEKAFLSFIGEHYIDETLTTLLNYAPVNGLGAELQLVPEHVISQIRKPGNFVITE